ncbi:Methenyltetrahydrofolate cyclohydrolase / Methylenetetrahydrofolate dehydrogenase (NADP+) [Olavius algarvensis spirochete endosymbiont]|nr:Methenyltetrahydrofolate cyclohydrolase / Methylenetetrahydrofolate dehydrogenase (NADP+) [Olavius algarvensis spirochete endosymbiont]
MFTRLRETCNVGLMGAKIIDGKAIAAGIRGEIARTVSKLTLEGTRPGLGVVLVGQNPASISYVNSKENDCDEVGIYSHDIRLPANTSESELLHIIDNLNHNPRIHGILVQLPLPKDMNEARIIAAILPEKDVDGFHPANLGRLLLNLDCFIPCTPYGIVKILEIENIPIEGAEIVLVGRSRIVGAPLANLLFRKGYGGNATLTVCHSYTRNIEKVLSRGDIIIVATGNPGLIKGNMIRNGTVVIDVGINRVEDSSRRKGYKLVGDVDFDSVKQVAKAITPVPGGVGPVTRAMLLWNTAVAAQRFHTDRKEV